MSSESFPEAGNPNPKGEPLIEGDCKGAYFHDDESEAGGKHQDPLGTPDV